MTLVVWLDFMELGADPTGLHDSSEALSAASAITAAHEYGALYTRGRVPSTGSSAQPTPPVMHPLTLRGVGSNWALLRACGARRRDGFPVWLGCARARLGQPAASPLSQLLAEQTRQVAGCQPQSAPGVNKWFKRPQRSGSTRAIIMTSRRPCELVPKLRGLRANLINWEFRFAGISLNRTT